MSTDDENQLAAEVAGFADPVRRDGIAELVARHLGRTNRSCRDQFHDALKMRPIAPDTGP
jgi:hypothetical protein